MSLRIGPLVAACLAAGSAGGLAIGLDLALTGGRIGPILIFAGLGLFPGSLVALAVGPAAWLVARRWIAPAWLRVACLAGFGAFAGLVAASLISTAALTQIAALDGPPNSPALVEGWLRIGALPGFFGACAFMAMAARWPFAPEPALASPVGPVQDRPPAATGGAPAHRGSDKMTFRFLPVFASCLAAGAAGGAAFGAVLAVQVRVPLFAVSGPASLVDRIIELATDIAALSIVGAGTGVFAGTMIAMCLGAPAWYLARRFLAARWQRALALALYGAVGGALASRILVRLLMTDDGLDHQLVGLATVSGAAAGLAGALAFMIVAGWLMPSRGALSTDRKSGAQGD